MNEAMAGQEAVIDTIEGKTPYRDTDLERNVVKAILAAMKQNDVRRLIVTSTLGAGNGRGQASLFLRTLLLPTFLRGSTKDKEAMEQAVEKGGVNFIIVRPAVLNDHESTGTVRTFERTTRPTRSLGQTWLSSSSSNFRTIPTWADR